MSLHASLGPAPAVVPAHRLVLSGAAWRRLLEVTEIPLTPEFTRPPSATAPEPGRRVPGDPAESWSHIVAALDGPAPSDSSDADEQLRSAGVFLVPGQEPDLRQGPVVHPSVVTNLLILARPTVLLRIEATVAAGRRLALIGLVGALGATLVVTDQDGAVELSLFSAMAVGPEIIRLVPPVDVDQDPPVLPEPLVLPLDAVSVPPSVAEQTLGELHVDVLAAVTRPEPPTGHRAGPSPVVGLRGRVVWLATSAGWLGVRPVPDGTAARPVQVVPVEASQLPGWLAPMIATALDATDPLRSPTTPEEAP